MLGTIALILALSGSPIQTAAMAADVDVELLLAVDMSGSMDMEEARVQRSGYLQALRHPDFINAVQGGLLGRIAIGYFEWAGLVNEASVVNWQVIENAADAEAFAAKLEARPIGTRRGTSISNAILFGTGLIDSNAFSGGDGSSTSPVTGPTIPGRRSRLPATMPYRAGSSSMGLRSSSARRSRRAARPVLRRMRHRRPRLLRPARP